MITLAKKAGVCPGVKRAHDFVEKLILEAKGAKIYTLGQLIHNEQYNESLRARGVFSVSLEEVEEILKKDSTKTYLVVRTHGIPKEVYERLRNLEEKHPNFSLCDMTCPFVSQVQKIARDNTNEDT